MSLTGVPPKPWRWGTWKVELACYGLLRKLTRPVGRGSPFNAVKHQCRAHPRYQAKLKPRTACEGCWRVYLGVTA